MLRKLVLLLPVFVGVAVALADGPATDATASSASGKAVPADAAKEPAKKRTARPAKAEDQADAAASPAQPGGDVKMSGMSILGNEDAPKSLVLVPWKSSQLGDMPSVSRLLDSSKQPVDKEVFLRELSYYEFRTGTK
ncbi:MAG TPA: hypothetical protein VGR86_00965 [Steroidobacteraceae bacterium]|nr:hypothetical protein [Steroidobacteraceae bacterium]